MYVVRHNWPLVHRGALAFAGVSVLFVLSVACTPFGQSTPEDERWTAAYSEATSLPPDDALRRLEQLAEHAPDQEKARAAELDRAKMLVETGDIDAAETAFQALRDERDDDNIASRALYELGRIAVEHHDDLAEGRRLLTNAIVDTPPWAGSEMALQFLIRTEHRAGRTEALVDELDAMATDTDDDRMAAQIHLERGLIFDEHLGDPDAALDAFRAAFDRCDDCASTDEALYQMANIYLDHQQYEPAIEALEIIADRTQDAWFIGTYHSLRASDARYLLGRIEMLHRQNYDAATDHFERFLDDFEHNLDTDRVAWHLVTIERLTGTERSYRRALEQFLDDHPESRYADDAEQRLREDS